MSCHVIIHVMLWCVTLVVKCYVVLHVRYDYVMSCNTLLCITCSQPQWFHSYVGYSIVPVLRGHGFKPH